MIDSGWIRKLVRQRKGHKALWNRVIARNGGSWANRKSWKCRQVKAMLRTLNFFVYVRKNLLTD
jgi:hypothetical protein